MAEEAQAGDLREQLLRRADQLRAMGEAAYYPSACKEYYAKEAAFREAAALAATASTTADVRREAIEECARVAEEYPSPLNDLPMALAMRSVAAAIRALSAQERDR